MKLKMFLQVLLPTRHRQPPGNHRRRLRHHLHQCLRRYLQRVHRRQNNSKIKLSKKIMEQMQTQFQQMQLREQEQRQRHAAQIQQQQTLIQQLSTQQEQTMKRIEDRVEADVSQQQQRQRQRGTRRRSNETNAKQTETNEREEGPWGNFRPEEQRKRKTRGKPMIAPRKNRWT